jgi:lysophospholipase L1-like esterase
MIITLKGADFSLNNIGALLVHYTITYKYVDSDGKTIKPSTTESVAAGTSKTFTISDAPTINGYTINSVSPTSVNINSNTTVIYTYVSKLAAPVIHLEEVQFMAYIKKTLVDHETVVDKELLDHIQDGILGNESSINQNSSDIEALKAAIEKPEVAIYYAACGDSITHANHALVTDIDADDEFYPIDGYAGTTYARKNYAYYIAQRNGLKWANYGYGGTTLHSCYPKGYGGTSMGTRPFVEDRITQLKEGIDWDYISIFFGYNDVTYGPAQQKDFWLTETYGEELGYPINDSQIGTAGFATAEQKAACDAATGTVGGIEYTDNNEYFFAKFIGTIDDTEKTTFLGAYNYALDYLFKKYPNAKIMIVNPYTGGTSNTRKIMQTGVKAMAQKWGVPCMDFNDLPYWFYRVDQTNKTSVVFKNTDREDGRWYTENGKASYAGTVEGFNHARFTTDGTHPGNLGYKMISRPIEKALINS